MIGTDAAPLERLDPAVRELDIDLVTGGHDGVSFAAADLIVLSPGVPRQAAVAAAAAGGVLVWSELELASRFVSAPLVAVGGTNGKSTVTTLVGEMLRAAWARVFVGGNLGIPLSEAALERWDAVVVEVSSFQLEAVQAFRPRAAVLLNVTDDHLDRYDSFQAYADAKGNAFLQQTPDDVAVVPAGDALCRAQAERGHARIVTFGAGDADYAVTGSAVIERASGERFDLGGSSLHGRHNLSNAAAAIALARALAAPVAAVREGLATFRALPHRMALAGVVAGVRCYDDSKGTNVGAAVTAVRGLAEERVVLIAGGRDKLGAYEPLVEALRERGRALVVLGEAADRIAGAARDVLPVEHAVSMSDAVSRALRLARPGDAVLLSPACSSFDMFKSYAERGDRFTEAVRALAQPRGESA